MRSLLTMFLSSSLLALAACGAQSPTARNPVGPSPTNQSASLSGTWIGSGSDSSGSMMGAGMTLGMMGQMTWQITQTGNTFTGTMQFRGYPSHGAMTVSGIINGSTATFTMSMPSGAMMMANCTATARGTFDINEFMTQMHGRYTGSNTCTGPFKDGHMSVSR